MKKTDLIWFIVPVAVIIAVIAVGNIAMEKSFEKKAPHMLEKFKESLPQAIDEMLPHMITEMNKKLPAKIDDGMFLDSIILLPGKNLQHNYSAVNFIKEDIDTNILKNFASLEIIDYLKTEPQMFFFRDYRFTMMYNYKDKNGEYICQIIITPDMYELNANEK